MKQLVMCVVAVWALAACAVDSPDVEESAVEPGAAPALVDPKSGTPGESSIIGTCSTRSLGGCAGAPINSTCSISPRRWCLPANELPDGTIQCLCQSQSTI